MAHQLTLRERIKALSAPLAPRPTETTPRLPHLPAIRAVVFDVYGTLLVSASGDISLATAGSPAAAVTAALNAAGVPAAAGGEEIAAAFRDEIHAAHAASSSEFPEVEIREIWRRTLQRFTIDVDDATLEAVAVDYECRVNPVWPMPGMTAVLDALAAAGYTLGIVSNAQFLTPLAMEALSDRRFDALGFDPSLCVWSYALREAKPGTFLYEQSATALAERGLAPPQVLYVGNDMRNDIWPAQRVGFRTALFAGDDRSLRLRADDPRVAGVTADAILTELPQLLELLGDHTVHL